MKISTLLSIFVLFHGVFFSSVVAMNKHERKQRQIEFLNKLYKNAKKTDKLSKIFPQTTEDRARLQELAEERNQNGITIIEFTKKKMVFRQETSRWTFGGYCWKKNVNSIELVYGDRDSEADLFGCSRQTIDDNLNDDNSSLVGWNVYFKTDPEYCFKTKLLASSLVLSFSACMMLLL